MRKLLTSLLTIGAVAGMILTSSVAVFLLSTGVAFALPVESGGWAKLEYDVTLPGHAAGISEYQHTHAEAGIDIATGTPQDTDDNYDKPFSSAHAETSPYYSYGNAEASISDDYVYADNWASAGSTLESWGYGSSIYKVSFNLSTAGIVDIDYNFTGEIWADSSSEDGSAFSVALGSIWADNYSVLLWDSDPDFDDYVEVIGVGSKSKNLSYSDTISPYFDSGSHEIIFTADTYENAAVPEPGTMLLLGFGLLGLLGYGIHRKKENS